MPIGSKTGTYCRNSRDTDSAFRWSCESGLYSRHFSSYRATALRRAPVGEYVDGSPIMSSNPPKATFEFQSGHVAETLEFLKRTRNELRSLQKVRIWKDHVHILDVNKDYFEIRGLGYLDPDIVPVLQNINTAFNKDTIHNPTDEAFKEFNAGRRYTWAQDRVM
jgi:hypothetical protein